MNATRIIPDLQGSILCEEVRQESNGNFIIVGVLGAIRVPKLPVTAIKLSVFNRWTAGLGQFTEGCRLVATDQTSVLRQSQVKFKMQDPSRHSTNVTVFGQVQFSTPGVHYVEVLIDDIMKIRYPFSVIVQPPQDSGAAASADQPQTGS
jgi:hypothetical protein